MGLKVLKNRLSEYVRLAQSGEVVLITDRDRVVAELSPPARGRAEPLRDAELAEAVRNGWITPPTAPGQGAPPRQPVLSTMRLREGLDEDRSDRC